MRVEKKEGKNHRKNNDDDDDDEEEEDDDLQQYLKRKEARQYVQMAEVFFTDKRIDFSDVIKLRRVRLQIIEKNTIEMNPQRAK